ncbi:DUF948 domain-containing protein [Priestia koreensis]|uniref:DUF948 domain-containing protein n=1 Tax=Priestia koreensis TaxID=284581 RepID=UPI001F560961|nr:DUF948 domain-containing protein [Priestia koreensis]UNL86576.1 DUF948 domain-containing protein [Priestia koreensis]
MIIVYISIAVIVFAIIYLGIVAVKSLKELKPTLNHLNETSARMQAKVDAIKNETNQLSVTTSKIQQDVAYKKETFQGIITSSKETPKLMKKIWTNGKPAPQGEPFYHQIDRVVDKVLQIGKRRKAKMR